MLLTNKKQMNFLHTIKDKPNANRTTKTQSKAALQQQASPNRSQSIQSAQVG